MSDADDDEHEGTTDVLSEDIYTHSSPALESSEVSSAASSTSLDCENEDDDPSNDPLDCGVVVAVDIDRTDTLDAARSVHENDDHREIDDTVEELQSSPIESDQFGLNLPPSAVANATSISTDRHHAIDDRRSSRQMMATHAKSLSMVNRLGGARNKSAFDATMTDIGVLGIGVQLYFMLTKGLSIVFLIMGFIAFPTMVLHYVGGHGIPKSIVDPLQLAYASLGNEGVHESIASDPKQCLPRGRIDCSGATVDTPFTTNPVTVSWIVTISDCAYSLVFLAFVLVQRHRTMRVIATHAREHITPAKYAVVVRGLPRDATEREILAHFHERYDPTQPETYYPLWFGCCWGRRRTRNRNRMRTQQRHDSRDAVNKSVVTNVDHLVGITSVNKELYLNTWIAEVSVAHPIGELLRTFLRMEALTLRIAEARELIEMLERELELDRKQRAAAPPPTGRTAAALKYTNLRNTKLLQATRKRHTELCARLERKKGSITELKRLAPLLAMSDAPKHKDTRDRRSKVAAKQTPAVSNANAATTTAANLQHPTLQYDACECAFVVFNNLESRRRCLQDYRKSTSRLARQWQPKSLRFRDGTYPLTVTPAPEPSTILWENLDVTPRSRFCRRSLTNVVAFVLLFGSAMIISAAQSAQQQYKDKLPPTGLCETKLPQVFYGSPAYAQSRSTRWTLVWDEQAVCARGATHGEQRYHVAYDNNIHNALNVSRPTATSAVRCVDPCVSEASNDVCNTLPCFDQDLLDAGQVCETYAASHVLYCYCSNALLASIEQDGYVNGAKALWRKYVPCRHYVGDFAKKNSFLVLAALVVLLVNALLERAVRWCADVERHESESARALGVALKLFAAQFINTAVVVLVVNASLGLARVPVIGDLLKGKYKDFERDWYPTVGMGITTTMLLNAVAPQLQLAVRMFVVAPLRRALARRTVRTQTQMNALFAGPSFDLASRYPMVLNSVFVTLCFCGGSPILLFIAALSAAGTYWLDKLALVYLFSVTTTYDEALGNAVLSLLPTALVLHLAFSTWMYGNATLLQSRLIDMVWVLNACGLSDIVADHPHATNDALYDAFRAKVASLDVLGPNGLLVKVLRANVMLVFMFLIGCVVVLLSATLIRRMLWPLVRKLLVEASRSVRAIVCRSRHRLPQSTEAVERKQATAIAAHDIVVVLPEFTDVFRQSIGRNKHILQADKRLGFARLEDTNELMRLWPVTTHLSNGTLRHAGERMRTWEAMNAPTRSFAIEANAKYKLAAAEVVAVVKQLRAAQAAKVVPTPAGAMVAATKSGAVTPLLANKELDARMNKDDANDKEAERSVLHAVAATDAVDATTVATAPSDVVDRTSEIDEEEVDDLSERAK